MSETLNNKFGSDIDTETGNFIRQESVEEEVGEATIMSDLKSGNTEAAINNLSILADIPSKKLLDILGYSLASLVIRSLRKPEESGKLAGYLNKIAGLDEKAFKHFFQIWSEERNGDLVKADIESIILLEHKQNGATKILFEEFGIKHFSRYNPEILIDQIKNKDDTSRPYGIVVYPESDSTGAFSDTHHLEKIYQSTKDEYNFRIYEVGSKISLAKMLLQCQHRYFKKDGSGQKISFLVLGGHGITKDTIRLGGRELLTTLDLSSNEVIPRENEEETGHIAGDDRRKWGTGIVQKIADFFVENPIIILDSCSSGDKDGIGTQISKIIKSEIPLQAPSEPARPGETVIIKHSTGQLHISQEFLDERYNRVGVKLQDGKEVDRDTNPYSS